MAAKKRKLEQNDVVSSPAPALSHDDLRQIIKPLTHEQLSEIVITAALRHPDVIDSIRSIADVNPSLRSLSIQNLDQSTTTKRLTAVFAEFGELEKAKVVRGKISRKCKGYVVYKHVDSALLALKEPSKLIDGKITVVKLVDDVEKSKNEKKNASLGTVDVSLRRVYVGNVDENMDREKLLECFEKYGEIEEGPSGFDKETGKFRGFAFIVYRNVEGVKACLVDPVKIIDGHELNCRLASIMKRNNFSSLGSPPHAVTAAQVSGSGDGGKGEVVIPKQESSNKGSSKHGGVAKEKLEAVDVSLRRVYVGNVPAEMDCEKLLEHFSTYGEVESGPLGFHKKTGKFEGFAFIVYKTLYGVRACLVDPVKIIDGHKLNCRLAVSKQGNPSSVEVPQAVTADEVPGLGGGGKTEMVTSKQKNSKKGSLKNRVTAKQNLEMVDVSLRRVYIGNLPTKMEYEKLLEHFSMYGEVEGGPSGFTKKTGKSRGFACITYKNVDGAKACLVDPFKIIDGHELCCRLAIPKKGQTSSAAPAIGSGDEGVFKSNLEMVDVSSRRVYVGNVPPGMDGKKLFAHFSLYGEVEDEPLGFHRKAKFNGFALILYKNVEGAKACLVNPTKTIDGYQLRCRLAIPRKWNSSTVTEPVDPAARVPGPDSREKRKFVSSEQQSLMQSSHAGGSRSGVSDCVKNMGGLGLPAGPSANGNSSYGVGGPGQPLEYSPRLVNLNLGGRFGLTSSLSNCGSPGLLMNGGEVPGYLRGGSDGSYFGLGTVYDGLSQRSQYGSSPGSVRMTSEGYAKGASYSLSSGYADQTQQQHYKYMSFPYK
uniref:uncharacterized protein LOC122596307 n=1 Tax=Erigeron canadensis TaxID=72917 RepID=UPI001CB97A56|nr:uncharacterized protein LOC122596307 [Erigeron canadensis]